MTSSGRLVAIASLTLLACHGKGSTGSPDAAATTSPQLGPAPSALVVGSPIPSASVMAKINPANLPAYGGPTGSVEGTIRIDGPDPRDRAGLSFTQCPAAKDVFGKTYRQGAPGPDGTRPLADAVVAVTGYSGFYVPERKEAVPVTFEDCSLGVRTVVVTFGQRLEVQNKTKEIFAPTLAQVATPAIMITNALTEPVKIYPPHPGYFTLIDTAQAHSYAQIDVYALPNPLHAVSGIDGHYRIDGVPVGKLKVDARLAAVQRNAFADVEVHEGVVEHVDVVIHAPLAPPTTNDAGLPLWVK
jgi:hypothetical protein